MGTHSLELPSSEGLEVAIGGEVWMEEWGEGTTQVKGKVKVKMQAKVKATVSVTQWGPRR